MKKIPFLNLDLTIYQETLENGLEVCVIPKDNVNNTYATLSTRYGSDTNEFVPLNENKMVKVPAGIAHFLEHKMFEQEDGIDPFTFYSERGADCNANTSKKKTTYLFSGTDNFKENLEYLLDYVQSPYFTLENVEKEKGIIEQEIKMYDDDPVWVLMDGIQANTFHEDPAGIPIAGTVESIRKITKEDLYLCYHTFYHPSNMFLIVTGKVDPKEVITIVKENQAKKHFEKSQPIQRKEIKEKKTVKKRLEEVSMDVVLPKFARNYKIDISAFKNEKRDFLKTYLNLLLQTKFGETSLFLEELKQKKLITFDLGYEIFFTNQYAILTILGESEYPKQVLQEIDKEMKEISISEEDFKRKIKTLKASYVYLSDNIYKINHLIQSLLLEEKDIEEFLEQIKMLNCKSANEVLKRLDYSNLTDYIITPKH